MADGIGPTFWQEQASMAGRAIGSYMAGWLVCKNLGVALIIAPCCATVYRTWYNASDAVTMAKCCVNSNVNWFFPNCTQFAVAVTAVGYQCWYCNPNYYWTNTEVDVNQAYITNNGGFNGFSIAPKNCLFFVLAMRCVTY